MELQEALLIANKVKDSLSPYCEIINVAGSCRRLKPEVKDFDILCLPKMKVINDVFGEPLKKIRTAEFVSTVELLGDRIKGSPKDGKNIQTRLKEGIILDLYIPVSVDYYRQLAIRTGSGDYSKKILATGWRKKGWCGSDLGLRRTRDCIETKTKRGTSTWKCVNPNAEHPPVWKSEGEFFDWINVKWVEPPLRTI